MKFTAISLSLTLSLACISGPSAPARSAPRERHDGPNSPLSVRIDVQAATEQGADLQVTLERSSFEGDVVLSYQIPVGVQVTGLSQGLVSADRSMLPVSVRWNGAAPPEDLVIQLAIDTPGLRARSSAAYRFGRPEPALLHVDSRSLGTHVGAMSVDGVVDVKPPVPPRPPEPHTQGE